MISNDPFETHEPKNMGEMPDADSVGTAGNPDCGDMVRMWLKYKTVDGKKVIDKATFQSFGCQTALAVASAATELLKGKTPEEARALSAVDLAAPAGALPPVKMHCGEMVEGALRQALNQETAAPVPAADPAASALDGQTLLDTLGAAKPVAGKLRVVFKTQDSRQD